MLVVNNANQSHAIELKLENGEKIYINPDRRVNLRLHIPSSVKVTRTDLHRNELPKPPKREVNEFKGAKLTLEGLLESYRKEVCDPDEKLEKKEVDALRYAFWCLRGGASVSK